MFQEYVKVSDAYLVLAGQRIEDGNAGIYLYLIIDDAPRL